MHLTQSRWHVFIILFKSPLSIFDMWVLVHCGFAFLVSIKSLSCMLGTIMELWNPQMNLKINLSVTHISKGLGVQQPGSVIGHNDCPNGGSSWILRVALLPLIDASTMQHKEFTNPGCPTTLHRGLKFNSKGESETSRRCYSSFSHFKTHHLIRSVFVA